MSDKTTTQTGGIGFAGLLTILFIGLKLTHYIDWSWWWVLSPLWIGLALWAVIFMILSMVLGVAALIDHQREKARKAKASGWKR